MGGTENKTKQRLLLTAAISAAIVGIASQTAAMPFAKRFALFTAVLEYAKPPAAWYDFCRQNPGDCMADPHSPRQMEFTDKAFEELSNINRVVNTNIKPKTDKKHWGLADKWSYPDDGYGDCEDYALLKRKLLIEIGWSPAALLMAVVWDKDAGHAVLIARTDKGEYVLDNQNSKVLLWSATKYKFVKRQSPRDLKQWVYIDGDPAKPNLALAAWEKSMPAERPVLAAVNQKAPAEPMPAESEQVAAASSVLAVESAVDQPMKIEEHMVSQADDN